MSLARVWKALVPLGATAAVLAVFAVPAEAQTGTVQGTVRDATSNAPIASAQVFIPGTRIGTVTDQTGRYIMTSVPVGRAEIRVRMVGYTRATAIVPVTAGQTTEFDFALTASVIMLDEVVVTGTGGAVEKKQLGNTIVTLDANAIVTAPVKNFSEAIAAREAGVEVLPSGGMAGEGSRIRIRGIKSLSQSNEPVIYVDGVRMDRAGGLFGAFTGGGGLPSRLDDINPEAIERVEILKGAAAATLYGSEANSGVIQIFTKRGERGATRFNFRVDQGLSQYPAGRHKANAGFARYADLAECKAAGNSETSCRGRQGVADRLSALYGETIQPFQIIEKEFINDWLFGRGHYQSYSGDVSGGGDVVLYNIAGRFTQDDGLFEAGALGPGADDLMRRIHGSLSITLFPRERFRVRAAAFYTDTHQEIPQNNNNIYGVISSAIFGKPEVSNCEESRKAGLGGEFGEDPEKPGHCAGSGNPLGQTAFGTTQEGAQLETNHDAEHFNGSVHLTYEATRDLNLDLIFGVDAVNQNDFSHLPFGNNVDNFSRRRPDGFRNSGARNHRELTVDAKARWNTEAGMISSSLVGGAQGFISRTKGKSGFSLDFPGPGLAVLGAGAVQSVFESFLEVVNAGLFAEERVGLNNWIFLTGGGRWDKNSAFGEESPSAFYPKVSASIIPSDMPGWRSTLFSTLRLRGALGKSGQQPGAFDKLTTFGPLASELGPGLSPGNLGNPDLKPEVALEKEVGAELALFSNRVAFDVTGWWRETQDALIRRQFPVTGGFIATQLSNIGLLDSRGWDLKVNALVADAPNLSVQVFANAAFLRERILDMGGAPPEKTGGAYPRYRQFLIGPDTLADGTIRYWAPGTFFGTQLLPECGTNPVYLRGDRAGQQRLCWTQGQEVPFDTNRDKKPDTVEEFKAFLTKGPVSLDDARMNPMADDEDDDGDFQDHYLGKPNPDWSGAFGATITFLRRLELRTTFEYKTGEFFVSNLTDAFRKSNPLIGRNIREAAEVEEIMLNPAKQNDADARLEAAMTWATKLRALSPVDGLNQVEDAKFIRWRELSLTYTAPAAFAGRLGLSNLAFNAMGRNIALWTPYTGVDPELNAVARGGSDFLTSEEAFGVPIPRHWTLSVRFGF